MRKTSAVSPTASDACPQCAGPPTNSSSDPCDPASTPLRAAYTRLTLALKDCGCGDSTISTITKSQFATLSDKKLFTLLISVPTVERP
uniref:Uncharacterized protein n=1 Tax=Ralstonia solanacearum TaxID=305 RepID=A0A0S4UFS9_RALSL|nr:protein of unknown function [Ralstonia solanacearum]CUV43895.1 protein of unknown function [Ralstonia solanacearum]